MTEAGGAAPAPTIATDGEAPPRAPDGYVLVPVTPPTPAEFAAGMREQADRAAERAADAAALVGTVREHAEGLIAGAQAAADEAREEAEQAAAAAGDAETAAASS